MLSLGEKADYLESKRFAGDVWQKVSFVRAGGGLDKAYLEGVETLDLFPCGGNSDGFVI